MSLNRTLWSIIVRILSFIFNFLTKNCFRAAKSSASAIFKIQLFIIYIILLNIYTDKENNMMSNYIPRTQLQRKARPILSHVYYHTLLPSEIILKQIHDIVSLHLYIFQFVSQKGNGELTPVQLK